MANILNTATFTTEDGTVISTNTVSTPTFNAVAEKTLNIQYFDNGRSGTYTILFTNLTGAPLSNVVFTDILDPSLTYTDGSLTLDGASVTPASTSPLSYVIPTITTTALVTFSVTAAL